MLAKPHENSPNLALIMPWFCSYKWNRLNFLSWAIELKAHRWLDLQCASIPLRNRGDKFKNSGLLPGQ